MYNVSIDVRAGASDDLRNVTLAGDSLSPLTVEVASVPNGDGSMWWEVTEDSREMMGRWMGIDARSPGTAWDWVLDLEVQIVERVAAAG